MARSVGSIEVTVDANTRRLKAQLTEAGAEGGAAAKAEIEEALGDVDAEIDISLNEADLRRIQLTLERLGDSVTATLGIELEDDDLARAETTLSELGDNATATVGVELEDGDLARSELVLARLGDTATAQVGVDIDNASKAKADALLRANFADVGGESGDLFIDKFSQSFGGGGGGGGGGGLSTRMQAIVAGIVLLMEPAAVAIEGLASGAVQVLSSAFSALATTGGALLPIIAGLGATMGAVVIGSLGMGAAIKASAEAFTEMENSGAVTQATLDKVDKAMRQLTPAARGVAQAIADMLPQFRAIQSVIAEHLFAGLGAELKALSSETIPDIGNAFAQAGSVANRFFFELSAAIQGIDFAHTFAEISPALDSLGRAIASVVRTIQPFFEAAAPAARELGAMIERAAAALLRLVEAGNQSGAITRFFDQGLDSLRVWGDLIANVGRALFTLFEAGTAGGNSLIQSLSNVIGRFNDWMNTLAGQSALQEFFDSGREALSALTPLLQGLVGFFDNIVSPGAIDRFRELAESIGAVLPVLGQLFEIVGRLGVLDAFAQALAMIGEALQPAIPALQQLASAIGQGLNQLLAAAAPLLSEIGKLLGEVAEIITPLIPSFVDMGEALIEAFTPVVAANLDNIVAMMVALAPAAEAVFNIITVLANVFDHTLGPAITGILTLLGNITRAFGSAFDFIIGKIGDFIGWLDKIPFLGMILDWAGFTEGVDNATEATGRLNASAADLAPAVNDAGAVISDAAAAAENATTGTDLLEGSYADLVPAIDDAARAVEGDTAAAAQATVANEKLRKEQDKLAVSLSKAEGALRDMSSVFEQMARREDSLSKVFDLGNAPAVAAAATRDIQEGIGGLKEALSGIKVGDVLAGSFKADDFLDAIDNLAPQIQAKLSEAFALDPTGETARADALRFIAQVTDALGGAFTPQQVAEMLGLADFDHTIEIAVELTQVAEAKAELAALTGLGGETPLTATIGLALDKGTLSGDAAQAILNELAIANGIPAEVLPEVTPEGMAEAQAFIAAHPGLLPVNVQLPDPVPEIPVTADTSQADSAIEVITGTLAGLKGTPTDVPITADTTVPTENIEGLIGTMGQLDQMVVDPPVSVPGAETSSTTIDGLLRSSTDLSNLAIDPNVSVPGAAAAANQLDTVSAKANALDGKTVDVSVFIRQIGKDFFATGGVVGAGGGIGGEAGPELAFFRNQSRLLTSPTQLQPGTVVVPISQSAATTIGDQPVVARQVNNYMTFNLGSTDPAAVATQVVNRAAALASL